MTSESTLLGKCTVKSDLKDSRLDELVGNDYETTHKRDYDGKKSKFRFNFCGDGLSYATVSVEQVCQIILTSYDLTLTPFVHVLAMV